jgi:uncharacterized membrane protein YedE/YeeE
VNVEDKARTQVQTKPAGSMQTRTVILGVVFGFVLSRAGATDYDAIRGMFRLTDLHLMGVIGTAVALLAVAFALARKAGWKAVTGEPVTLATKPMVKGLVAGSLLFGVGWGITGTCPGTALAQIGEGRVAGLATFVGILVGAYGAERWNRARASSAARAPSRERGQRSDALPGLSGGGLGGSPAS